MLKLRETSASPLRLASCLETVTKEAMAQPPRKRAPSLSPDEARLLTTLARFPAMWPGSPADAARLQHLIERGYLIRDLQMKTATFRLTIRGWAFVRGAAKKDRPDQRE